MAYIMLPQQERTRSGWEDFSAGLQPGLQQAMDLYLQQKVADIQRQRNIEQSKQMFPNLYTEIPTQFAETSMGQVPIKPTSPKIPKQYRFDIERAQQYPGLGIDLTTGGMEYKVPSAMGTMPVINITPEGRMEQVGTAPKGARILTPSQMETPEQKQIREVETAQKKAEIPTADIRNLAKQSELQLENVRTLKQEASKLSGGYQGITERGIAIATRGAQYGNVYAYERKLPAFAAGLYRSLTGDNRLSDMDAQARALPLLWNTSIDISLREPMFNFLEKALEVRKKLLSQGKYIQTPEGDIVTPLETILQETQKPQQTDLEYQKYLQAIGGQ